MTEIGATSSYTASSRYTSAAQKAVGEDDTSFDESVADDGSSTSRSSGSSSTGSGLSSITIDIGGQLRIVNARIFDTSSLQQVDVSSLPEDEYQSFVESQQQNIDSLTNALQDMYTQRSVPAAGEDPRLETYAKVVANGQLIATIDNQGVITGYSSNNEQFYGALPDGSDGVSGPELAQARADALADLVNGNVVKSETAMSQSVYDVLSNVTGSTATVDEAAMESDPIYTQLQNSVAFLQSIQQQRDIYLASQ